MAKIEVGIADLMSLLVNSSASSEDIKEEEFIEDDEDGNDVLEMSDEDFEKLSEEDFSGEDNSSHDDNDDIGNESEEDDSNVEANEEETPDDATEGGSEQAEAGDETEDGQPDPLIDPNLDPEMYKSTYNQLFGTPIKANGRDFQLRDGAHARSLIEMGADYNKKMQHMRPHMQTLKTLEKEGLLEDVDQLNLLLEVKQGNPDAIRKLLAQSKVDLLDVAEEREGQENYVPQNHIVSQAEVEIEQALETIKKSPAYQETLDIMSNTFDTASKKAISENPSYITALNADIESGLYPRVMDMVQYQRDTRQIPNDTSDIDAYIGAVRMMAEQEQQQQQQAAPVIPEPEPARKRAPGNRRRKVGMSGSRSSPKKGAKREYDPMAIMTMSDDDFEKKFGSDLQ